jgi:hypothetical protein
LDTGPVKFAELKVGALFLDLTNPRHEAVEAQDEAIESMIIEQGPKLRTLMEHIAEHGLSPVDRMMVVRENKKNIVVEGNRRIAALKVLDNTDLAKGTSLERAAIKISKERAVTVTKVDCAIADDRDEARPWILIRHDGEAQGAGTVRWKPRQAERFNARPGSQSAKGSAFLDAVEDAYADDETIGDLVEEVGKDRITTLGRLVADPNFRSHLDIELEGDAPRFYHDADAMRGLVEKVLRDLSGGYSVSNLKSKDQRKTYINSRLPNLKKSTRRDTAGPLVDGTGGSPKPKPKPKKKPKPKPKPKRLFPDLELNNLGSRIPNVLEEAQKLKLEEYPNAAAILVRVVLELSVDQVIDQKGWKKSGEFKNRLRYVLHKVDSTDQDPRFQALRTGLQHGDSPYAVATLHSFVHNAYVHPTANDALAIAENLSEFLAELDDLA